jgi:hypothetical protein
LCSIRAGLRNHLRHFGFSGFSGFRARILVGGDSAKYSKMGSGSGREEIQADGDALRTAVSRIVGHPYDAAEAAELGPRRALTGQALPRC